MQKIYLGLFCTIMALSLALSCSLFGHENYSNDNEGIYQQTAYDRQPPEVVKITTPVTGSSQVKVNSYFIIIFNEELSPGSISDCRISFQYPKIEFNSKNSLITFTKTNLNYDTAIICTNSALSANTLYKGIIISGFKDRAYNTMLSFVDDNYHFDTCQ
jgi:hypothetical protein